MLLQHLVNALNFGSLYGLIAIGYTMVYGILRLINFAHGDLLMLGAYFVFFGMALVKLPLWAAIIAAIALTTAVGMFIERVAYRPLREAPRISVLISAIAVSFFLESLAVVVFGGVPKAAYQPEWLVIPFDFDGVKLIPMALIVPTISLLLVLGLLWVVFRTRVGLAMRAISRDIETTRLLGVRVDAIIALTFGIGSALAAAAGIMWALRYPQIHPYMGVFPGLKAFVAAVFGGIGSIHGAMIGGLAIGFIEIMSVAFYPQYSGYRDAIAFVLLVLVLLIRPNGLFGQKIEEKI
jgi:branched-chain amino acid transport system permease protein